MADTASAQLEPMFDDPTLSAVQKLDGMFRGLAAFKAERKDFVLAVLRVWLSDDNAIVREKSRRLVAERLLPWLTRIVNQGVAEGTFTAASPDLTALVLGSLMLSAQEVAADLWVARQHGDVAFEEVMRVMGAYRDALERILGAPEGSVRIYDEPTMRVWFG
jgi:hypothetical protein